MKYVLKGLGITCINTNNLLCNSDKLGYRSIDGLRDRQIDRQTDREPHDEANTVKN